MSKQSEGLEAVMQEGALEHQKDFDPHFSEQFRWNFTLQPLREAGAEALDVRGIEGIGFDDPTLRELEVHSNNSLHEVFICKSDDLFRNARRGCARYNPIPLTGTLARASFALYVHGEDRPRTLHIRPPYWIQLVPALDLRLVFPWLDTRRFRIRETIAKVLVILLLACSGMVFSILDTDDDDPRHRSTLVSRR